MVEVTIQIIKKELDKYNCRYRTAFMLSEKYSLFPKEGEYGYNDEWPGNKHAGVYFVIAQDGELLYVGESQQKTIMDLSLGYFSLRQTILRIR